jgi:alkylation response protein AidB-like acyl-CoA dehydrogenase
VLHDTFVPDSRVLGQLGAGWKQVTSELALERSGPERILSTYPLLVAALRAADGLGTELDRVRLGELVSRLWGLRQLSLAVAGRLEAGDDPVTAAALVKDLGTVFEGDLVDAVRAMIDTNADLGSHEPLARMMAEAVLHSPGFTIRGGTNEILRGIVAKALGAS